MTAHSTNNRKKTRGHRPRLQQSKRTLVGAVYDRAFSLLAQRYGHASAPSVAVYGPSDLLHHGLHLQSSPDSGSAGCTQLFYRIWVPCLRVPSLGWPLRDHAGPHSSVCRFRTRIHNLIRLDEVVEKRDLEDPQKRDFSRPALAERLLRSCHSIPGVL